MKTTSNKPSHRIYAVTKRNDKSFWADAGAVWAHKDGKGFNLKLDILPLNGAELVIREPQADGAAPTEASAEGGF
jgi:hypothetical protein